MDKRKNDETELAKKKRSEKSPSPRSPSPKLLEKEKEVKRSDKEPSPQLPAIKVRNGKNLCIHRKFIAEKVDRNSMSREEYANFLSQPKWSGSPWYEYLKHKDDFDKQKKQIRIHCQMINCKEGLYGRYKKLKNDRDKFFFLMNAIKHKRTTRNDHRNRKRVHKRSISINTK